MRLILCKSRRAGLSTGVESLIFDDALTTPHTDSLIVSHQAHPSENVLSMCTTFYDHLPKAIRFPSGNGFVNIPVKPELHRKYQGNMPSDKIEFAPPLYSRTFIATAKSIDAYRSFAFQNIHATEAAHYDNATELFTALSATVPDDPHTAFYIESTPNGMGGRGEWFYEQVLDAELRGSEPEYGEYMLVFIPWHEMPVSFSRPFDSMEDRARFERSLKQYEKDLIKQFPNITLEALNWRRIRLTQPPFNKDEEAFMQEYPESLATGFLASGALVFSRASLQRVMLNTRPPLWEGDVYWGESDEKNRYESAYNYVRRPKFLSRGKAESEGFASHTTSKTFDSLKVWRWPEKGDRIIIGADVARGNPNSKDGDFSTICVLSINGLLKDELIMTWRGRINTIGFADVCAALAWAIRYRVGDQVVAPILAPEWTGPGTATCTEIDERHLYPLWHYRMPGVQGFPASKHVGWESNGKTKPFAVGKMVKVIEDDSVDIPSKELALEMASYRQQGTKGFDATWESVGTHDDLVSSFQIANAISSFEAEIDPGQSSQPFEVDLDAMPIGDSGGTPSAEAFDEFESRALTHLGSDFDEDGAEPFDELAGREWY